MNNLKLIFGASLLAINSLAQQNPTNNNPSGNASGTNNQQFWSRAGNTDGVGTNNIFGTMWNSPVYHYTNGQQRMVLFGNTTSASTPFGGGLALHLDPANPIPSPKSLLTIGTDYDATGVANSGWRPWMKVGTFNTDGSDFAYFGLKREGSLDRNDAIIAWGDDLANPAFPNIYAPDYMRFIFSADRGTGTNAPNAQGNDGLEIARLSPTGHMGIGNFYNSPLYTLTKEPARQLEILSDKISSTANGNALLRLTHTQQNLTNLLNTGLFSEFEPRNNGDLFISVRDNTQTNTADKILKERFVGINTNAPGNTVEINSQLVSSGTANGNTNASGANSTCWAGLRFTDLKSSSVTQTNPGAGVLSVDGNGDVILVNGGSTTTGNNGINVTNTGIAQLGVDCSSSFAVKWDNRLLTNRTVFLGGRNLIFADGGRVNIGGAVNACNVGNKLEITSGPGMPYYVTGGGGTGSSGLRLTFLTSAKTPVANGFNGVDNTKVLSVDANGDVVLVNASGDGATGVSDHDWYEVGTTTAPDNINDLKYTFNNTGIGMNNPNSRVDIFDDENRNALRSISNDPTPSGEATYRAGRFEAITTGPVHNHGIYATAANGGSNFAGYFISTFAAGSNTNNYGIYAVADGGTASNIGIYASAPIQANSYAGYFNGDVYISGSFGPSDQKLKENVDTISNALAIINKLKPKAFTYKQSAFPSMNLPNGKQYGLIAQEVETVIPELVSNNTQPAKLDSVGNVIEPAVNFKGLEYQQLIPFLIKAMQEQQAKIDSLTTKLNSKDSIQDARLSALENAIAQCCSNANNRTSNNATPTTHNSLDIELSDKDAIVLNQNVPNPFAEQTTITYNVPESVGKAQIIFYNTAGQIIQTVDIKTRGKGKVNVFANDLSSGLYNYTLVADGKVVDSKKMVRE